MVVPRPCFFIVRPNVKRQTGQGQVQTIPGPIVPVIAVDELPEWLDIVGVPRELSIEDTIGLCNLGTASKSNVSYAINISHRAPAAGMSAGKAVEVRPAAQVDPGPRQAVPSYTAPEPHVPAATNTITTAAPSLSTSATTHPAERMKSHWSEAPARQRAGGVGGLSKSIHRQHHLAAPGPSSLPAAAQPGPQPAPDQSPPAPEYCRHWCHHGTCKGGLQCRYVHAMPTTAEELVEVGLAEIPAWWVLLNAASTNSNGNGEGTAAFDQRDVRRAALQQLGLLPSPSPSPSASASAPSSGPGNAEMGVGGVMGCHHHLMGGGGGGSGGRKKFRQAQQLRETVALLRALGLVGGGRPKPGKVKEMSPLDKGPRARGGSVPQGGGKKAALTAAAAAMLDRPTPVGAGAGDGTGVIGNAAVATTASAGGAGGVAGEFIQAKGATIMSEGTRDVHMPRADQEKRAGGQDPVIASAAVLEKAEKLVDV
ncbi:hypothetical protein MFIFM68171_00365 [Madurella fahalii]|uniref:C3H1-type domain-containing protein n=1 Tax=Madurella fahalii TaxID=1157608 RepID=A0ABQ0FXU6_9PEZI